MQLQANLKSRADGMMTIGEVARRTGLRASAIRYYEAEGLLPKPLRVGGKRVFDASIVQRLAVINLAQAAGFSLSEIKAVVSLASASQPAAAWQRLTKMKRAEIEREMRTLALRKRVVDGIARCNCHSLDDCGRAFTAALAKYVDRRRPVTREPLPRGGEAAEPTSGRRPRA